MIRLAVIFALTSGPAFAVPEKCSDRRTWVNHLYENYNEVQFVSGIAVTDVLFEIFVNQTTRSYTILLSDPSGQTCIVQSGHDFEQGDLSPPEVDR